MAIESHNVFQNFFKKVKNVKLHLHCHYLPEGILRPQVDSTIHKVLWLFDRISLCHQSGVPQLESVEIDECVVPFQEGCILYHGSDNHMLNSVLQQLFCRSELLLLVTQKLLVHVHPLSKHTS